MNRILLVIAVLGGFFAYNGTQELKLAEGATTEPIRVDLLDIEAGKSPANPHLRIGEHWEMNHELVYSYKTDRDAVDEEPAESQRLDFAYYPIVAADNAFFLQLGNLEEIYDGLENVPEAEMPELAGFSMIVRTERYARVSDLPDPSWAPAESVTGLVANRVRAITDDEAALIRASFPTIDVSRLVILEEGRKPASVSESYAQIGGGALVALSPLAFLAIRSRMRRGGVQKAESLASQTDGQGSTGPGPIA